MKGFLNWCFLSHCEMFCAMVLACCKPPLGHDGCMGWGAWAACGWRGQARTEHHLPAPPPPPRDEAVEKGWEMGITQGEVFLLPPSNEHGKNASRPTPCPSWSLDLPEEGVIATSKPSGPS